LNNSAVPSLDPSALLAIFSTPVSIPSSIKLGAFFITHQIFLAHCVTLPAVFTIAFPVAHTAGLTSEGDSTSSGFSTAYLASPPAVLFTAESSHSF